MLRRGIYIITAWLLIGSGWWIGHPASGSTHVGPHSAVSQQVNPQKTLGNNRPRIHFPHDIRSTDRRAAAIGQTVLRSVEEGRTVAGVVVGTSGSTLYIRDLFHHEDGPTAFELSPTTVIWRGGWRFVGRSGLGRLPVNLVVQDHTVVGILTYHDAYGRVVKSQGDWVAIQAVNRSTADPACAAPVGRPLVARIMPSTVWNSRVGALPPGSLVQYTVYGLPGYPLILGGIEDYGHATCQRVPSSFNGSFPLT